MPYVQKVVDCGKVRFVKRYFATRHGTKGQVFRSSNENKTSAAQESVNDRNKIERFAILANANFDTGDYFVTFTYERGRRPKSVDEAREQWNKILRRLRNGYKKQGTEIKYLWCLEHKKYAYHFHLLCNNEVNSALFSSAWEYGGVNVKNLDTREYHTVGEYMMKEQYIKEEKTKTQRCYGSSRNLIRPEAEITILEGDNWKENPEVDKYYTIEEGSLHNDEVVIEGLDFSYRYQSYIERQESSEELWTHLIELNPRTKLTKRSRRQLLIDELEIYNERNFLQ